MQPSPVTRSVFSGNGGIVSGEGVAIDLARAGLGSRTIAALIDFSLQCVALIVALLVDSAVGGDGAAVAALVIAELIAVLAGYPILCEWLWRGRTLGKLALGLRVVRDDGGPIGLRQALVRGVSGLVLEKPGLLPPISTALGMCVLGLSSSSKRIGDFMAGTFVVNERMGTRAQALVTLPLQVPYGLQGWAAALDLTRLDDQLALSIRQFVSRAHQLDYFPRESIGNDLANRVLAVIAPPPPMPLPASAVLVTVLAERRRRADLTAPGYAGHAGYALPQVNYQPSYQSSYQPHPHPPQSPQPSDGPFTPPA